MLFVCLQPLSWIHWWEGCERC